MTAKRRVNKPAEDIPSIAVIGAGYWGTNLIRNYHELGALRLICDKNEKMLDLLQDQYPKVETCMALSDVLSRDDINGVIIATPAETHFNLAREALLAGKHVFVEKPLALDEKEAEEIIDLSSKRNLSLMVGHLLQYHPCFARLKELAISGELGRINYIYSSRLNLGKIRREENILWSFAPHDISMILSLTEEDPESVLSIGGNYLHQKIADVTTTHLEFPSGLQAHIFVSWLHPFKEQKLVVVGDRKMAVFDDMQPWDDKLLLYPHEIKWQHNIPIPTRAGPERVPVVQAEPLKLECDHFLNCIREGLRPLTDGHEGLKILRVLNAGQRSVINSGQKIDLIQKKMADNRKTLSSAGPSDYATLNPLIHATAVIDDGCRIGDGTRIWHFSHVLTGSHIGQNCNIGQNVMIGPDVSIGNNCKIQNNVSVFKGVTLEDGVFCGPSIVFTNIFNPRAEIRKMDQIRPILVKKGATLGANCTIVCGVTIGRYAFVGAGAVVNKDLKDHTLVVGNPARRIGWACKCGEKLPDNLKCLACGKEYEKNASGLRERK